MSEQDRLWWSFTDTLGGHASRRFRPVDVRSAEEWNAGHVPRSVNVPLAEIGTLPEILPLGTSLFVYGSTKEESERAQAAVRDLGYDHVIAPPGGYQEMEDRRRH